MARMSIDPERYLEAQALLAGRVHRTPMLTSSTAARIVAAVTGAGVAGGRLHLKAEHLQLTGSFKPRGATVKVASLDAAERAAGVITISAGNHGQALAFAAGRAGVHATVVMPEAAVRSKVDACRAYGAEVILHGRHTGETFAFMERIREERGLVLCHPYDDPAVIAGQGTVGLEILEDVPDVDVIVVGIGGGGLISGIAGAVRARRPSVRVYGVEPVGADAIARALAAGQVVRIQAQSVADGLNAPFAGEWTLAMIRDLVEDVVLVTDDEIRGGMRFAAERLKQVLEPAGAAALAAMLLGRLPIRTGDRVCVVLSGGNVELGRWADLAAGAPELAAGS